MKYTMHYTLLIIKEGLLPKLFFFLLGFFFLLITMKMTIVECIKYDVFFRKKDGQLKKTKEEHF